MNSNQTLPFSLSPGATEFTPSSLSPLVPEISVSPRLTVDDSSDSKAACVGTKWRCPSKWLTLEIPRHDWARKRVRAIQDSSDQGTTASPSSQITKVGSPGDIDDTTEYPSLTRLTSKSDIPTVTHSHLKISTEEAEEVLSMATATADIESGDDQEFSTTKSIFDVRSLADEEEIDSVMAKSSMEPSEMGVWTRPAWQEGGEIWSEHSGLAQSTWSPFIAYGRGGMPIPVDTNIARQGQDPFFASSQSSALTHLRAIQRSC